MKGDILENNGGKITEHTVVGFIQKSPSEYVVRPANLDYPPIKPGDTFRVRVLSNENPNNMKTPILIENGQVLKFLRENGVILSTRGKDYYQIPYVIEITNDNKILAHEKDEFFLPDGPTSNDLLKRASSEIKSLRNQLQIANARLEMFDAIQAMLHTEVARKGLGMSEDVLFEIEKHLRFEVKGQYSSAIH